MDHGIGTVLHDLTNSLLKGNVFNMTMNDREERDIEMEQPLLIAERLELWFLVVFIFVFEGLYQFF